MTSDNNELDQLTGCCAKAQVDHSEAGLAPLLLTVIELVRQLMEAQVIRRMEGGDLSDGDLDRASESLRKLGGSRWFTCAKFLMLTRRI
jgi:hypothetical protein